MDYLARDTSTFSEEFWSGLDKVVVEAASRILVGRRFLTIFGPLGPGLQGINIDSDDKTEEHDDGVVRTAGRTLVEVPQLYDDFNLLWRDIAAMEKEGYPIDLTPAMSCAESVARREDKLVFFGSKLLGISGLTNAKGVKKYTRGDWSTGENAYKDVAKGLTYLNENGFYGRYALIVSNDIFLDLQRLQQNTGMTEMERVSKMLDGRVFRADALGLKKALMVCCEPQYMDIAIGQDIATAYVELADLNHHFRILETALPRLKRPEAVVSFD